MQGHVRVNSYVIDHDWGFAPNPFHGICTLACCKPDIRKHAALGELVIGTSSTRGGRPSQLVYWMRISETLTFDEYWEDKRFRSKRPNVTGSFMMRYGDNIYHRDEDSETLTQENSFHSEPYGGFSKDNFDRDTSKTERVLIGEDFTYWGGNGPVIPDHLVAFVKKGAGHKCYFKPDQVAQLEAWLAGFPKQGYLFEPELWKTI